MDEFASHPKFDRSDIHGAAGTHLACFVPTLGFGGVERVALTLCRGFLQHGCKVDLVAANGSGPFRDQIPSGLRLIDLKVSRVLTGIFPLAKYLRRERPDALIGFMTHATLAGLAARRIARVKTKMIATEHVGMTDLRRHPQRPREKLTRILARYFLQSADQIVAVSAGVAQQLSHETRVPMERIHIIHNPVLNEDFFQQARCDLQHRWFSEDAVPVILSAGRLAYEKDYATLLRAFAIVRGQRPVRLLILGEGPERIALERLAHELNIIADFALPGYEPNPYAYMARAAVFVLCSRWEGFGMALVEAMALGTPVISTDASGGPRELLNDGERGTLVPVGDVRALAAALFTTLNAPPSKVPIEELHDFDLEYAANQYLGLLQNTKFPNSATRTKQGSG